MLHQVYWVEHNVSPHDYYLSTLNSSCKHIGALNKNSQNFWHHPFICRKRISSLPTPACQRIEVVHPTLKHAFPDLQTPPFQPATPEMNSFIIR
jgi:hypothetical protein